MSQTFKAGDRVICSDLGYESTFGKVGVVVSFNGHTYLVEYAGRMFTYYPHGLLPYYPAKEPTMKIGEHEVKVVSRDEVRVGCQTVKRAEVEQVLKAMDDMPQGIKPSEIPSNQLAICVSGKYEGNLFTAAKDCGHHVVLNIGVGTAGFYTDPTAYNEDYYTGEPTFVKLLSPDDVEAMAKFIKERVR